MPKNIEKKKFRSIEKHEHKREEKKEHSSFIPIFFGVGLAVVLLFGGIGIGVASATDYYVATDGSDSNPGTLAKAWRTIGKANQVLQPGDTVYLRGGTYHEIIEPFNSGSAGKKITYKNYPGEIVYIKGEPGTFPVVSIGWKVHGNRDPKSYIVIDGFHVSLPTDVTDRNTILIFNPLGGHNELRNCVIDDPMGTFGWDVMFHTDYNIIENNYIKGHKCGLGLENNAAHNIVRNNVIESYDNAINIWNSNEKKILGNLIENNILRSRHRDAFEFDGGYEYEHRGFIIRNNILHNSDTSGIDLKGTKHILIEGNIIYSNPGNHWIVDGVPDREGGWGGITRGTWSVSSDVIIRNNIIYDCMGGSIAWPGYRIYNNIIVANNRDFLGPNQQGWDVFVGLSTRPCGSRIKNNIIGQHDYAEINTKQDYGNWEINNNCYLTGAKFKIPDAVEKDFEGWKTYLGSYPGVTGRDANSIEADPLFVNVPDYPVGSHEQFDFHLQSNSPCIDAGTFLTRTTSSGSGTGITVEDAKYFCDGFGITNGDLIQVGSNSPVRITNVDYNNNVITVDQSITWNNNDGVSLPYNSSAPDIGAYEYAGEVSTGTISGTVKDKGTGLGIPGATVTADGNPPATTNTAGQYTLSNMPVGTYTVTASATGYQTQSQENVQVLEGETTAVNFQLTEASDLVGLWHFDEGSGEIVVDLSIYANNGTLNGPTWVDGKLGKALWFDGIDDYVEVPSSPSLNITDAITIILWMKPLENNRGVIRKIERGGGWEVGLTRTNQIYLTFENPIEEIIQGNTNTITLNEWNHVAVVFSSINDRAAIYINGELDKEGTITRDLILTSAPLRIGTEWWCGSGLYYKGTIDEVRIYNRTLSAEEIKADYEAVDRMCPSYDINEDGKVDILDTTIVGQHFGETTNSSYPRYDVNEDGKVDILDTTIVGQHFGEITS